MFLRVIFNEVKKNTFSLTFLASVLCIALMCFTSGIYVDIDSERTYSVLECLLKFDYSFIKNDYSFAAITVFSKALSSRYMLMFIPVLSSLSFLINSESGFKSTYFRYEIYRTSKLKMIASRFLSGLINGGLVIFAGLLLFGLFVFVIFPDINSYEIDEELKKILIQDKSIVSAARMLVGGIVYGMFSAVLPIIVFELIRNIYVSVSISFMIIYLYDILLDKIILNTGSIKKYQFLYPHSIISIFQKNFDMTSVWFDSAFTVVCFCIFYFLMSRKVDCSE